MGHIDEDGYLYIRGRKKNTLITSYGRNVSPEWVESELLALPEIGQVVAYGDAQPELGALIVPASQGISNEMIDKAIKRANATLPEYAHVLHWVKVLPFTQANGQLTGTGRAKRDVILKEYKTMIEKSYETQGQSLSFFDRLIAETATQQDMLRNVPQLRDGLMGAVTRETYIAYLAEAYHHVKHTVPLMECAKAHMPDDKGWLIEALDEYIEEETGHEEWILNDIRNAGGDAEAVRHSRPRAATEFMVSYAYDYISRVNPVGFFGMVFVLEGTSTAIASQGAEAVMKSLGLPKNCFSYLISHGALDLEHMQFFAKLMGTITDPEDQDAIIHMAQRMFELFAGVFSAIPHKSEAHHAA